MVVKVNGQGVGFEVIYLRQLQVLQLPGPPMSHAEGLVVSVYGQDTGLKVAGLCSHDRL